MDDLIERLRAYIAQREKIRDGGITITECNGVPLTVTDLHEAADALKRLVEALEHVKTKLEDVAVIRGGHGTFAGTYLIVTEALDDHDQEVGNG